MLVTFCGKIARFFSGGPYRFLAVLLLGALSFGWGWIFDLITLGRRAPVPDLLMVISSMIYLVAAGWYGYLIVTGRWKEFWSFLLAIISHWDAAGEQFLKQQQEKKRLKSLKIVKKSGSMKG